jgi:hypothetical protein
VGERDRKLGFQPFATPGRTSADKASSLSPSVIPSTSRMPVGRGRHGCLPFIHRESHALKNASINIGSSSL